MHKPHESLGNAFVTTDIATPQRETPLPTQRRETPLSAQRRATPLPCRERGRGEGRGAGTRNALRTPPTLFLIPLLFCSGCGSNVENILLQSFTAAGRTALDIWLTELANDIADNLDDNADNANDNDDNGNANGNGNDNGGGGGNLDDLTGDAAAGATVYAGNGCAGCHCDDGSGGCALSAPSLTGVDRHTLDDFLRGAAPHPAKPNLSDQEIVDLEAFLAE